MMQIPGLFVRPDDDEGQGIEICGFKKPFRVPESHRHGNCEPINNFEKLATIEEGSFGVLYKCRSKRTNEIYALKKYKMPADKNGVSPFVFRELQILRRLKHKFIVNGHGMVAGRDVSSNYLVLDFCEFSLNDLIEKNVNDIFRPAVVKNIMKQLFTGVQHICEAMIIHWDICCENVKFSSNGIVKITGFQHANYFKHGSSIPEICHLKYAAPELLLKAEMCTAALDIWSVGCIFARLLLKRHIFEGNEPKKVLQNIFTVLGLPSEAIWPGYDRLADKLSLYNVKGTGKYSEIGIIFKNHTLTCVDIIKKILVYNPSMRLDIPGCLRHSYFLESPQACGIDDMANLISTLEAAKNMEISKQSKAKN